MLLDLEAGRDLETDVILGTAIDEATRVKVEVPTLKFFKTSLDILQWKMYQK